MRSMNRSSPNRLFYAIQPNMLDLINDMLAGKLLFLKLAM